MVGRPEIGIYLRWGTCWLGSPSVLTVGGGASPLPGEAYKATRSPALGRPLVTMKAVLLALLAVGLALQPGETSAPMGQSDGTALGERGQSGETRGALSEGTHPEGQREEAEAGRGGGRSGGR